MTNENKNINELVSADDDPTAELEVIALGDRGIAGDPLEADAKTFDARDEVADKAGSNDPVPQLEADLRSRNKTNIRLQFDIEQLRAKWLGLESEITAREAQTTQLNQQLTTLQDAVRSKEKLLRKRDLAIKSLKAEIRQRDQEHRALATEFEGLRQELSRTISPHDPSEVSHSKKRPGRTATELELLLQRSEQYADTIRQRLQDKIESSDQIEREYDTLSQDLLESKQQNDGLSTELREAREQALDLQLKLDAIERNHMDEIRTLRFELGEAEESIVETEGLNNRLASDLIDVSGSKDELERSLFDAKENAKTRVEKLQKEVKKLSRIATAYENKLSTKSEAISVLLAELAKKSEQLESIGEIETVIHEIDDRMSERFEAESDNLSDSGPLGDEYKKHLSVDRVTRVLVGTIDNQILRFPLFKDRLTIGRTEDNDIQLKAVYVSRRHAVIQTDGDTTRIIDWGSKNGINVNAARVKEHFLAHGDIITIGHARFRYEELRKR